MPAPHFTGLLGNGRAAPVFFEKGTMTTTVHNKEKSLFAEIAPQVERDVPGVEVLALELSGPDAFRVYVDHPAGVDHALCERVTNVLGPYLQDYAVEVSSPGSERPLRTPEHFADAIGRRVALRTGEEIEGRRRFRGEVVAAGREAVTVSTGEQAVDVPYEAIVRGNLIDVPDER
jgi:ribosome maturation factor RimP